MKLTHRSSTATLGRYLLGLVIVLPWLTAWPRATATASASHILSAPTWSGHNNGSAQPGGDAPDGGLLGRILPDASAVAAAQPSAVASTTLTVVATIHVGRGPTWVAVNQATNQIYVANFDDGAISVIDGATNRVVKTVSVGTQPRSLAFNPTTNRVYVANNGSGTVTVLDAGNNFAIVAQIPVNGAWHVAVNPATNIAYVTMPEYNEFAVVDGASNTIITTVATLSTPTDVAIDTLTNGYYISDGTADGVSYFNGRTNRLRGLTQVGDAPDRLTYDASTNEVYASNPLSQNVSVINCATNHVVATIPITGYADESNADDPDGITNTGPLLLVGTLTTPGYLLALDATTDATLAAVQVGNEAIGVAVNPQTNLVYTANQHSNTVSVIKVM